VSGWSEVFLGVIAVAVLAMAVAQVGVLVAAGRLARRMERVADLAERELKPIFEHVNAIARDASHAAALASAQVERADRVFADVAERLDATLTTVQTVVTRPAREGIAVLAAFRAALSAVRSLRADRARARADDEDALFI
jgi:hypothetical protein